KETRRQGGYIVLRHHCPAAVRRFSMRHASFCAFILLITAAARGGTIIDPRMHHLRWGEGREWAEFPVEAEGTGYVVSFDAHAGGGGVRRRDDRRGGGDRRPPGTGAVRGERRGDGRGGRRGRQIGPPAVPDHGDGRTRGARPARERERRASGRPARRRLHRRRA